MVFAHTEAAPNPGSWSGKRKEKNSDMTQLGIAAI
jgi:hypothetical protein